MDNSFWKHLSLGAMALAAGVAAADSLTIQVEGVRDARGSIVVSLCADATGQFPGGCSTYRGRVPASTGQVELRIDAVPAGRYAVQAFHDANGNSTPEIPPEGYAFGNNAAWPPSFSAAAVQVSGASRMTMQMQYVDLASAPAGQAAQPPRSRGADAPPGVTRSDVRGDDLYGAFYAPNNASHRPALLLLGGSEGGLDVISAMATSFAQEGFAVLALAYFGEEGLPATLENIPLEYFDRALDWLAQQPQVDAARVGVLGWSRGSEAALLLAARRPDVKAVVGVAPSGVVWQGLYYGNDRAPGPAWTLRGKPLPALEPDTSSYLPNATLVGLFLPRFDALQVRADAHIPVERVRGGILLISGGRDAVWPAARFADHLAGRLQALDHGGRFTHLHYPDAGHAVLVGDPEGPMARAVGAAHPAMGGTPAANIAAWQDSWPRTLSFLHRELGETP